MRSGMLYSTVVCHLDGEHHFQDEHEMKTGRTGNGLRDNFGARSTCPTRCENRMLSSLFGILGFLASTGDLPRVLMKAMLVDQPLSKQGLELDRFRAFSFGDQ